MRDFRVREESREIRASSAPRDWLGQLEHKGFLAIQGLEDLPDQQGLEGLQEQAGLLVARASMAPLETLVLWERPVTPD